MSAIRRWALARLGSLAVLLPEGRMLAEEVWHRRHRVVVRLAAAQALALGVLGCVLHGAHPHQLVEALVVALPVPLAATGRLGRKARSAAATTSLFAASAVLVHLCNGLTEAHFHFFVMVGVVALYQDWIPFGIGLLITVVHHGVLGTVRPEAVYGSPGAAHDPWLWAGVHGVSVLAASLTHLSSWRLNEQQGLRDALTGLANRTLLTESLARLLARPTAMASVLFIDLDDFKDINDSQGHAVGDELLLAVADRLRGCVRSVDLVARLGGDEFAVLMPVGPRPARSVATRVLGALAEPLSVDGRQFFVSASLGLADTTTAEHRTAQALLRNADLAMYLAKAGGKSRLTVYADGMDQAVRERAELTADLGRALADGQLDVHYQPTVALADGRPTGYEALLRWNHPTRGSVPPGDFIALAEETGLILAIGAWVLRTATAQAARWSRESGAPVEMAVNLSPRQVAEESVLGTVAEALRASGLPPGQLTLEITEGVLVRDQEVVASRLARLRDLGVRIAIDDFGTGYSSLSYLRRLPIDVLKVDRSFVADVASGGTAASLVGSILDLARSLHLDAVAEGVETEEQARVLRDLRCPRAQGYLYARPMPAAQVRVPAAVLDPA